MNESLTFYVKKHLSKTMKYKKNLFGLLFYCLPFSLIAQIPHISGEVHIDVSKGRIACDLRLRNIPEIENTSFLLNKGLNLKYLKADDKTIAYEYDYGLSKVQAAPFADAFLYEPILDSMAANTSFHLKYTGSFPLYFSDDKERRHYDDQVTIAFKDHILRASSWTKWYPWFYNRKTNRITSKVTYDLIIKTQDDSNTIYINGSTPLRTSEILTKSSLPYDLFLYVGEYESKDFANTSFLNAGLTDEEMKGVDSTLKAINDYYNKILGRNDQTRLYVVKIFKIGPEDEYYPEWALAEYPAIIAELDKLPNKLNEENYFIEDAETFKIYAHEMAHQYWGIKVKANNNYWGFYSESFAEYFSLLALEEIGGKEKYSSFLKAKYLSDQALKFKPPSLEGVEKPLNVYYCYNYYPMLLVGLQQIIGKERMIDFFNYFLEKTDSSNIDLQYFERMAKEAGVSSSEWAQFMREYVQVENCLELVKSRL